MEDLYSIQAISPLDGRYSKKVNALGKYFSEFGLIRYRIQVEIEWLIALSLNETIDALPAFSESAQKELRSIYLELTPEKAQKVKDIEKTTNHDVKAVEYYINDCLKDQGKEHAIPMVHFACTSEDINNLSYALMLKNGLDDVMIPKAEATLKLIKNKAEEFKNASMVSRTHGQLASPTTMGKEWANVGARLERQLNGMKQQQILGKINGAVGNFNAHQVSYPEIDWKSFSAEFVEGLGLTWNPFTTQIEPHDYLAEAFHNWMRWNTILLDFDRDIWGYISMEGFRQIPVAGQTGSSTMPHKVNPIDFENSEGNLGLANAVFDHLAIKLPVSRWQRDLTDSTVLRNIGVAFGYSLLAMDSTLKGISKIAINEEKLKAELADSWEVIGEALQTVMRRYQIPEPYEKIKELTRGKKVDADVLRSFVEKLDLPEDVKKELKELTPLEYIGLANQF